MKKIQRNWYKFNSLGAARGLITNSELGNSIMADRPDPYVPKKPGDVIQSGAWNELQVRTREEIRSHTHQGGEEGALITREGIEEKAIDGSRIDPESAVTLKTLKVTDTVQDDLKVTGTASAKSFAANSAILQDNLEVNGTVKAGNLVGNGAVPKGVIVMWSGKENEIPPGWVLCDGQYGTPDLRGRFIAGAGGENADYQSGDHGEPDSHIHNIEYSTLIML